MPNLFVPLDVNYAEDDKIVDVGPMAELLYVRSLAFVKRARTDGMIRGSQLVVIGSRIPRTRHLAERLVDAGLWERNGDGWYICAWLKRNQPDTDTGAVKSDAGSLGAHTRWHLKRRRPDPDCKHCVADGLIKPIADA